MNVQKLQTALGVAADGEIGPITRKAFADRIIGIASKEIGVFETSRNHGEGIAKYWTATSYPEGYANREPYCAAFVCWVLRFWPENPPRTAAAFGFESWGRAQGLNVRKAPPNVKRGQLVVFAFSHIGIATSDSDQNGNFTTIEANTSPDEKGNQRDGGGVYRKTRNLRSVRSTVGL